MSTIMIRNSSSINNQQGLTLVEILVTTVVISVGLLGIAALHLTSLKNSVDSNSRSKAIWFVHNIEDKMRANSADASSYVITMGAVATGTSVAAADLIAWKNDLSTLPGGLPNGDGEILETTLASGNKLYTIKVQWAERDNATPVYFVSQTEIARYY
jgi:type IV pilus assembly protein PilV